MKNLFLAALLIVGMTSFAQNQKGNTNPEQKVDAQVKKMTKELSLDDKQVVQVKALVTIEVQKKEALKAEKAALMAKMKAEGDYVKAEMKKILTADQYSKWEQKLDAKKNKMKDEMHDKHGSGNTNEDK